MVVFGSLGLAAQSPARGPDIYFVPTPDDVIMKILQMGRVTSEDIVYDLGCGDGRIVIMAAKEFGARGVGIDIDPVRIRESNENARKAGVTDRVKFMEADLFQADIHEATVVTLYLLADLNVKLRPKLLRELKPGTRILSHEFDMGDWKPDRKGTAQKVKLLYEPSPVEKDVDYYCWVVPAEIAGVWRWNLPGSAVDGEYTLRLTQKFQKVTGDVEGNGQVASIRNVRLAGDRLRFTLQEGEKAKKLMRFDGRVNGDTLRGHVVIQGGPSAGNYDWTAKREPN